MAKILLCTCTIHRTTGPQDHRYIVLTFPSQHRSSAYLVIPFNVDVGPLSFNEDIHRYRYVHPSMQSIYIGIILHVFIKQESKHI